MQPGEHQGVNPDRVICVLGMHRSGTSCLTGSLQEAGINLGDCHTWNPHNRKGNRENQQIVDLNDEVLAANQAAWDRPRLTIHWSSEQVQTARRIIAANNAPDGFGFKDPRSLLTLAGWCVAIPHLEFIGIFRHPLDVAQSLHNRSGMPLEQGLALWYQYNRRLWWHYRQQRFPVLCFDDGQPVFLRKLANVLSHMGYDADCWPAQFYDAALRSAQGDRDRALSWRVQGLYKKLKTIAE